MKIQSKPLEDLKFLERELQLSKNQQSVAPSLDDEFYAKSYELRKAASTMTNVAIDWFRDNSALLLEGGNLSLQKDDTFSVLSVGSGEGDIDLEIIHSFIPQLKPQGKNLKYVA